MGIFSKILRPTASSTLERLIREHFGGSTTSAGVSVTSDSAMQQATVYSCVNILSRVIGMLPCHTMKRVGETRKVAEDFYLYPLLHDMPNEWMTSMEYWGMVMNHLLLRGNFYALKNRGFDKRNGTIKELIPLAPGIVQTVTQNSDYSLTYNCLFPDGTLLDIPGSEITHIRGMVSNGYMGLNPIQYMRESIGLSLAAEEFGARYFGSGTHPGLILEHPDKLSTSAHSNLTSSLAEQYSGLGKSHRIMLIEEGMKAKVVTINPNDAQFLSTRAYQKSEIVDLFFGMPLTVMTTGDNTPTFASAEMFSIGFGVYAITPWVVTLEKCIYRDLLTFEERKQYYAKFQMKELQRGSFKEQMEGFQIAINTEIMNPNEVRSLMDMNAYEGGNEYRTRTSSMKEIGEDKSNTKTKKDDDSDGKNDSNSDKKKKK